METPEARKLLRKSAVLSITGLSFVTLWKMMRRDEFPKPVMVGPSTPRWFEHEIIEWQESLARAKYKAAEAGDAGEAA
jgi:prophage regulatory protein